MCSVFVFIISHLFTGAFVFVCACVCVMLNLKHKKSASNVFDNQVKKKKKKSDDEEAIANSVEKINRKQNQIVSRLSRSI